MHSSPRRLTTAQAAERLGVDRATVYAYVSRGLLHPRREGRISTFDPQEIDRLLIAGRQGRRPASSTAVVHTTITAIGPDWLTYRGVDVPTLAGHASFESTCTWLWESVWDPDEKLPGDPDALQSAAPAVAVLPADAGVHARAITAVLAAAAGLPSAPASDRRDAVLAAAPTLLRAAAISATPTHDVTAGIPAATAPIAELLLAGLGGQSTDPRARQLINAALVMLADHDLAASTLAARVAASTGASVELALVAGLGALAGPMHGGSGPATLGLLDRCRVEPPAVILDRLLAGHERVFGLGQVVYRRDPRAVALLNLLAEVGDHPVLQTVRALSAAAAARSLPAPNIDLALAALTRVLELSDTAPETLHAVARIGGWVAHYLEETTEHGRRFRPQAIYEGPPRGRRLPMPFHQRSASGQAVTPSWRAQAATASATAVATRRSSGLGTT